MRTYHSPFAPTSILNAITRTATYYLMPCSWISCISEHICYIFLFYKHAVAHRFYRCICHARDDYEGGKCLPCQEALRLCAPLRTRRNDRRAAVCLARGRLTIGRRPVACCYAHDIWEWERLEYLENMVVSSIQRERPRGGEEKDAPRSQISLHSAARRSGGRSTPAWWRHAQKLLLVLTQGPF